MIINYINHFHYSFLACMFGRKILAIVIVVIVVVGVGIMQKL